MTGYDFSSEILSRYTNESKKWLRYFQRSAAMLDLHVTYRTRGIPHGRVEVYVTVEDHLHAMQYLYRQLPELAIHFIRVAGKPTTLTKYVLVPFFAANEKGVKEITDFVFKVTDDLGAQPAPLSIYTNLAEKIKAKGKHPRENRAIQTIVHALDNWLSGKLSNENTVILCDQGIEDWLKARLRLPRSSKKGFHDVTNLALESGLISRMEAYRLCRFHSTRNRVQHRDGKVGRQTVLSMLSYCIQLINNHD